MGIVATKRFSGQRARSTDAFSRPEQKRRQISVRSKGREKARARESKRESKIRMRDNEEPENCNLGNGLVRERCLDMLYTCIYAVRMSRMIQVRNVPEGLHRSLKARAALAGMSLSDYLLTEMKEIAERPTLAELRERLHKRAAVSSRLDTARLVREERESR